MGRGSGQASSTAPGSSGDHILYGHSGMRMRRSALTGSNLRAWMPQQIKADPLVLNDHFADPDSGWVGSNLSWMVRTTTIPEEWRQWVEAVPAEELDASAGSVHRSQRTLLETLDNDEDNWDRSYPVEPTKIDDKIPDWETLRIKYQVSLDVSTGEDETEATYAVPLHQLAAVEKMTMDEDPGWEWRGLYYSGPGQDSLDECDLLVLFDPSKRPQGAVMII